MKLFTRILIGMAWATLFASCEKEVNLDIEAHVPRLVVNSILHPQQPAKVYVSTSGGAYEPIDSFLTQATVLLWSGNQVDTLHQASDRWYYSSVSIETDKPYRMVVSHSNYTSVEATEQVPASVPFHFENYVPKAGMSEKGVYYSSVDVVFNDPPNQTNYYMFWAPEPDWVHRGRNGTFVWGGIWSNDPFVQTEEQYSYTRHFLPFSDALFDGKQASITIHFYYSELVDAMQIHLRCLSESHYKYSKSLIKHIEGKFADVLWGTTDPANLYSNIQNGYGIFAGYSATSDSLFMIHD